MFRVSDEPVQVLAQWTTLYGPIFKWNMLGLDMLVITAPDEVAKLSGRDASLPKAKVIYKALNAVRRTWVSKAFYHNLTHSTIVQIQQIVSTYSLSRDA